MWPKLCIGTVIGAHKPGAVHSDVLLRKWKLTRNTRLHSRVILACFFITALSCRNDVRLVSLRFIVSRGTFQRHRPHHMRVNVNIVSFILMLHLNLRWYYTGIVCAICKQNYAPVHTQLPVTVRFAVRSRQWSHLLISSHFNFWNKYYNLCTYFLHIRQSSVLPFCCDQVYALFSVNTYVLVMALLAKLWMIKCCDSTCAYKLNVFIKLQRHYRSDDVTVVFHVLYSTSVMSILLKKTKDTRF